MDFWPEFLASSWGKEFVAGGFGGIAGIFAGYPLDTLRVRQQQHSSTGSAFTILRNVVASQGPLGLYRGMGAPLASVTFQNAMVFQIYAVLSRAFDSSTLATDPPSLKGVAIGGFGTGAIQSLILSPVELLKVRLQLQSASHENTQLATTHRGPVSVATQLVNTHRGPVSVARSIIHTEGLKGIYRGLTITVLRDAPAHGIYFSTYEYMREKLHPGCRTSGQESFKTMLVAGGLAGVASWILSYPLDVVKTRLQAQSQSTSPKYGGIIDCFSKSVREEGYAVLWRGLGTALARAFIVNGAIFTAYETALRFFSNGNHESIQTDDAI
ncbi:mitochondrial arginine transporter BAC2 [Rhododendron vialii]|uniref:mitochondrial arginine transporter BAC2 n=1 Tax=Rhododendron vialii TaxID=182163 RepID=UPI00265E2B50|nr:mitochondrial arginine transporter BAC2 [Rhododendron vialii]